MKHAILKLIALVTGIVLVGGCNDSPTAPRAGSPLSAGSIVASSVRDTDGDGVIDVLDDDDDNDGIPDDVDTDDDDDGISDDNERDFDDDGVIDDHDDDSFEIEGRLESIGDGNVVVYNVTIATDSNTRVVGDNHSARTMDDLVVGMSLEVEAARLEDGSLLATKIEIEDEHDGEDDDNGGDDGEDHPLS